MPAVAAVPLLAATLGVLAATTVGEVAVAGGPTEETPPVVVLATATAPATPAVDSGRLITRPTLSLPLVLIRLSRASASGVTPYWSETLATVSPLRTRYLRGSG